MSFSLRHLLTRAVIVFVVFAFVATRSIQSSSAQTETPLFHLHFNSEEDYQSAGNAGAFENGQFVTGKTGSGLRLQKDARLIFPSQSNLNLEQGTVTFWFQPNWDGNDQIEHTFFILNVSDERRANSISLIKTAGGILFSSIDGPADDSGMPIEESSVPYFRSNQSVSDVSDWKAGQWHHIGYSWNKKEKLLKLYIDGVLRATTTNVELLAFPEAFEDFIHIGNNISETLPLDGTLDEFQVWDHMLPDKALAEMVGFKAINEIHAEAVKPGQSLYIVIGLTILIVACGLGIAMQVRKHLAQRARK